MGRRGLHAARECVVQSSWARTPTTNARKTGPVRARLNGLPQCWETVDQQRGACVTEDSVVVDHCRRRRRPTETKPIMARCPRELGASGRLWCVLGAPWCVPWCPMVSHGVPWCPLVCPWSPLGAMSAQHQIRFGRCSVWTAWPEDPGPSSLMRQKAKAMLQESHDAWLEWPSQAGSPPGRHLWTLVCLVRPGALADSQRSHRLSLVGPRHGGLHCGRRAVADPCQPVLYRQYESTQAATLEGTEFLGLGYPPSRSSGSDSSPAGQSPNTLNST